MSDEIHLPLLTASQENEIIKELGPFSPNMISHLLPDYNNSQANIFDVNPQDHFPNTVMCVVDNNLVPIDGLSNQPQHYVNFSGDNINIAQTQPTITPPLPLVPPPPTSSIISNEDYLGPLNFDVFIDPHLVPGNKAWVYSDKLRKVFIGIGSSFPVEFKCNQGNQNLFVRATPLFSLSQHAQEPVVRCAAHSLKHGFMNQGLPEHVRHHIIRCHNTGAVYQGDVEKRERLSVVVPLEKPQTGSDTVRIMYQFVCKNSCPSGMNRRPLEVVFTLEDYQGNVLGRAKVNIRICSCPKRDREKEERECLKRSNNEEPNTKKRKTSAKKIEVKEENTDLKTHEVKIPMVGSHNVKMLLKCAFAFLAAEQKKLNVEQPFQDAMDRISAMQDQLEQ